jgi:hypothetical protein
MKEKHKFKSIKECCLQTCDSKGKVLYCSCGYVADMKNTTDKPSEVIGKKPSEVLNDMITRSEYYEDNKHAWDYQMKFNKKLEKQIAELNDKLETKNF